MKLWFLILLPLLIAALPASTTTEVLIEGTFEATTINEGTINAELYYQPPNNNQQTINKQEPYATPPATIKKTNTLVYIWDQPPTGNYKLGTKNVITNKHYEPTIKYTTYPIKNIPANILSYTQPTKKIDLTPAISQQAQQLTTSNDAYLITHTIGEWVKNNIAYSLDTLTAEATYPSSWVYENKRGVCDEITNLFISMVRSNGIPARFVTGLVKTNESYNPHGWAEVYYPEQGWVPYDVTFGQYGWLDSNHVTIHEDPDPGTPGITYQWTENINVEKTSLTIQGTTISNEGTINSPVSISITPLHNNVGFGSYIPLLATITNNDNIYHSIQLSIT
ncbi:MAG: transglutaminase-like domain-containing protein, partial [Nanoarchaeota archaeon]|nr:transglutaminase-like domain-containing protein [Nanoarchaeota archaeon]